ncbi:MAG TPA: hypothetical protein VHB98_14665 [Chloroflexota bacterium]|jgi:hypothetical protein|nr:hypothetical protein [Chloroflexota bacterium]
MNAVNLDTLRESVAPQVVQEASRLILEEYLSLPVHADGFQRALVLEQRALYDALSTAPRGLQEKLIPLLGDLYAVMRSPIHPKDGRHRLLDMLVTAAAGGAPHVQLRGVLASPTAPIEARHILQWAALFRRHGIVPHLKLLLVRWENLIEIRDQDVAARARTFARQVRDVTQAALRAGFADAVVPIDVQVDVETAEILDPIDFHGWSRRISDAVVDPRSAGPDLARDIAWSTGFYARQVSLSRLGQQQALLDLAIRRAVGQRISAEQQSQAAADGRIAALITLEMHKRLLPCYAASIPIVNLDGRLCARSAAISGTM